MILITVLSTFCSAISVWSCVKRRADAIKQWSLFKDTTLFWFVRHEQMARKVLNSLHASHFLLQQGQLDHMEILKTKCFFKTSFSFQKFLPRINLQSDLNTFPESCISPDTLSKASLHSFGTIADWLEKMGFKGIDFKVLISLLPTMLWVSIPHLVSSWISRSVS